MTSLAQPKFPKLITFWALLADRVVVARTRSRGRSASDPAYIQNTIIVGTDDVGRLVARKLLQHPEYGLNLLGFADAGRQAGSGDAGVTCPYFGTPDALDR